MASAQRHSDVEPLHGIVPRNPECSHRFSCFVCPIHHADRFDQKVCPIPHADEIDQKTCPDADINGKILSGHKCQKMVILDRTSDSIKQGPSLILGGKHVTS